MFSTIGEYNIEKINKILKKLQNNKKNYKLLKKNKNIKKLQKIFLKEFPPSLLEIKLATQKNNDGNKQIKKQYSVLIVYGLIIVSNKVIVFLQ